MKVKAFPLIFLVIFALLATTSFVVGLSRNRIAERDGVFSSSCGIVQVDDEGNEPNGEPIDTPVMPG